ncbi:MAG TPA: PDZ domain-containing protein, partial [Vicinamibacterales bacterium]|nr:PDZ domain-containing protein [Vicinamibacterales bacterium]
MSLRTRLSVLLLSTPVLAFVLVGGLLGQRPAASGGQFAHLRLFQEVVDLVMRNYVTEVEPEHVMDGAMRGLADGLDADSAYLRPSMVRALDGGANPPDGDVGIELTRQYYLRVIAAREGSPAARAGLQTGDYVRAIDGRSTRDLSVFEGSRLLAGKAGTKTTLAII